MVTNQTVEVTPADIARYAALKKQIEDLNKQAEEIRSAILDSFDLDKYRVEHEGITYDIDVVYARGALDAKKFQRDFPASKYGTLYKKTPDNTRILDELGEDALIYFGTTQRLTVKVSA